MAFTNKTYKEKVISIYKENLVPEIEGIALEIKALLESIFKKKIEVEESPYNLTHYNSGYMGKYFKIVSRVKSGDSLGGKLVIKDDLFEIKSKFPEAKEGDIVTTLYSKYKDLIGIKILGDLEIDTENILKFLKDNKDNFISDKDRTNFIEFINLENQPDEMGNGKKIIKIDAIYHKGSRKYNFELQVKNQLLSAWGDMEHQQFYKNSKFSPIRKSHQPIMQDVGDLLDKIDKLLLSIRNSEKNYSEQSPKWDYHLKIQEEYAINLENLFEINVNDKITDLTTVLKCLEEKIKPDFTKLSYNLLNFVEKEYRLSEEYSSSYINKYLQYREKKFKLRVFEAITLTWYSSLKEINTISNDTYIKFISWLYEQFLETINNLYDNDDIEGEDKPFKPIFYKLLDNSRSLDYFLNLEKYEIVIEYYKFIKDVYNEWKEERDDTFDVSYFNYICYLGSQLILSDKLLDTDRLDENPIKPIINSFFSKLNDESVNKDFNDINLRVKNFIQEVM